MTFIPGKSVGPSKLFLTNASKLEARWDPNFYRFMSEFRKRVKGSIFQLQKLKQSLALAQYGISERATEEPVGVPMLRMINLQDDTWDLSELKYISMTDAQKKPYLLKHGDILFNRTNSKELVGKCSVFNLPGEYVFASYLIRVRLKEDTLLPDYVTAFLSSKLGRLQIDAVSRQIAGMTNINAEEIRALNIPKLDRASQVEVVRTWHAAIKDRELTLDKARQIIAETDDLLLEELGIPSKPDPSNTIKARIFRRSMSDISGGRFDPIANQEKRRLLETAIHASRYPVSPLRKLVGVQKTIVNDIQVGECYVGLENIDRETGEFVSSVEKDSVGTAISFSKGQVLFPKLRPYLNKTHRATFDGICSTEFHVFTPQDIDASYLTAFLRSRAIVGLTSLLMTGNTLPRLQMADIERLPVPIPPRSVQEALCQKIADHHDRARAYRNQARINFEKTKSDIEALILRKGSGR